MDSRPYGHSIRPVVEPLNMFLLGSVCSTELDESIQREEGTGQKVVSTEWE